MIGNAVNAVLYIVMDHESKNGWPEKPLKNENSHVLIAKQADL
jgi:hypothetical protein